MVSETAAVLLMGLLGMVYQGTQQLPPPQTTEDSSPSSSSSSSSSLMKSRIKLNDGRYLAYSERGVSKEKAKYKIIIVHGLGSSKEMNFLAPQVIT